MRTFEERLCAGLVALGWTEVEGRSKYREFRKEGMRNLFVGKAGALRAGNCASQSWSIGQPGKEQGFYSKVLTEGDKAIGESKQGEVWKGF